jgi:ferritin
MEGMSMLSKKMETALNEQINAELYSAYIYYSMSAYFETKGLPGFAGWMRAQAMEEVAHAQKFFTYINERGGEVTLKAIEGPQTKWDSPLAVFKAAYDHEVFVSGLINKLVDLASGESDHATHNFLQWFVAEQVEEEASADEIVQKLEWIGEARSGLFMLDRELGTRSVTPGATE